MPKRSQREFAKSVGDPQPRPKSTDGFILDVLIVLRNFGGTIFQIRDYYGRVPASLAPDLLTITQIFSVVISILVYRRKSIFSKGAISGLRAIPIGI